MDEEAAKHSDPWDVAAKVEHDIEQPAKAAERFGVFGALGEFVSSGLGPLGLVGGIKEFADGFNEHDMGKMAGGVYEGGKGAVESYGALKAAEKTFAGGAPAEGAAMTTAEAAGELGSTSETVAAETFAEDIPVVGQMLTSFLVGTDIGRAADGPQSESMRASSGGYSGKELAQNTGAAVDATVAPVLGPDNGRIVGAGAAAASRLAAFTGVNMGASSAAGRYMNAQDMARAKADRERVAKDVTQVPRRLEGHLSGGPSIAELKKLQQEQDDRNEIQMPNVDLTKTRAHPAAAAQVHQHYAD